MDVRALAQLSLTAGGTVDERVAQFALSRLARSELREYLAALKRELKRRRLDVSVPEGTEERPLREDLGETFPGREMIVSRDDALGGGVRVSAGDDVIDASVRGYLRATIEKLREP